MNNRVKLFIPIAFFLVMAGLLWFGLGRDPNVVPSALVNRPMPEFSMPNLYETAASYSKRDLAGQVAIVNVWGSWCPPCHAEHPVLLDMSERDPDLLFAGVSYDYSQEEDREFLRERGNPFDINIVDADGSLRLDLGVTGAPETFIVDPGGIIRYRHIGAIDHNVWEERFAPLIRQIRAEYRLPAPRDS